MDDSSKNILYVATTVCVKENADFYNYLLSTAMEFDGPREGLNNTSYTSFSGGHKGSNIALHELCLLVEDHRCFNLVLKNVSAVSQLCSLTEKKE